MTTWTHPPQTPQNTNPRWVLCAQAIGKNYLLGQPDSLTSLEFILWLPPRWQEFAVENGCRDREQLGLKFGGEDQVLFDAWLRAGVEAGKWQHDAAKKAP